MTGSEEGAKSLLSELPSKRLKSPIKGSFSSSIRADHPFPQLSAKQKGLASPGGPFCTAGNRSNKHQLSNTRPPPPTSPQPLPGRRDAYAWRGHRNPRLLTQEGDECGLGGSVGGWSLNLMLIDLIQPLLCARPCLQHFMNVLSFHFTTIPRQMVTMSILQKTMEAQRG